MDKNLIFINFRFSAVNRARMYGFYDDVFFYLCLSGYEHNFG